MVVISYRERNCKFLSGEVFTYKSKLYRGGRCCVMRFVRLTLLTGRTFSRGNDDLLKKKKKNTISLEMEFELEKSLSNIVEERIVISLARASNRCHRIVHRTLHVPQMHLSNTEPQKNLYTW